MSHKIKEDDMGGAWKPHKRDEEWVQTFSLKPRYHLADLDIDGRIILK
jgi:hypothetical protein